MATFLKHLYLYLCICGFCICICICICVFVDFYSYLWNGDNTTWMGKKMYFNSEFSQLLHLGNGLLGRNSKLCLVFLCFEDSLQLPFCPRTPAWLQLSDQLIHRLGVLGVSPKAAVHLLLVLVPGRLHLLAVGLGVAKVFVNGVFLQGGIKSSVLKTVVFYGNENALFSMFSTSMT